MRWKIVSTSVDENRATGIKTTTKKKQFVVTIGEAIGIGKTAVGVGRSAMAAIQNASANLSSLASFAPSSAGLSPFVAFAAALMGMLTGLEIYKKLMLVIEIATPIAQIAARLSGLAFSPLNILDIAQIALGLIEQLLLTLAISLLTQMRDMVWNYEFPLMEVKEVFQEPIEQNLQELADKVAQAAIVESINNLAADSMNDGNSGNNNSGSNSGDSDGDYANSLVSDISFGDLDLSDCIDWNNNSDTKWFSNAYISEYKIGEAKRQFRGSLKNFGIQYSDDGGKSWFDTEQTNGSFVCFAKIPTAKGYTYVAGSKDYIQSVKASEDETWEENKNYYFYDGENYQTRDKYYKENNEFDGQEKDEFVATYGIYYSTDDGIHWKGTNVFDNINSFCEFEEKEDCPATIIACSDDFNGCFYTEDGINWENPYLTDKWLKASANEMSNIRVPQFGVKNNITVYSPNTISKGVSFDGEVIVNFKPEIINLSVYDARDQETIDYYNRLAELVAEGKSVDEIYREIGEEPK